MQTCWFSWRRCILHKWFSIDSIRGPNPFMNTATMREGQEYIVIHVTNEFLSPFVTDCICFSRKVPLKHRSEKWSFQKMMNLIQSFRQSCSKLYSPTPEKDANICQTHWNAKKCIEENKQQLNFQLFLPAEFNSAKNQKKQLSVELRRAAVAHSDL